MAETVKKTKASAKPRKTSTTKTIIAGAAKPAAPAREEIQRLAEKYWAERGFPDGSAEQDWLRAEQELLQKASY
jgi:plasmid replication initiation protein